MRTISPFLKKRKLRLSEMGYFCPGHRTSKCTELFFVGFFAVFSFSFFSIFLFCVCVCVCAHPQCVLSCFSPVQLLEPARLHCPWDSSDKNTGVGCHFLLQGIFPTQGPNPHTLCLLHWQVGCLSLAPPGKPFFSEV